MNLKKTTVMGVTKTPDETITIKVDDANLEQVHHFKYHGTQITDDARTETEQKGEGVGEGRSINNNHSIISQY